MHVKPARPRTATPPISIGRPSGSAGNGSAVEGMVPPNGSSSVCPPPLMEAAKMLPSNWPLLFSVTASFGATTVPCQPATVRVSLAGNNVGERFQTVLSRSTSMVEVFSFASAGFRSCRCSRASCPHSAAPTGSRRRCCC